MKALVLTLFGYASLLVAMPAMARSTTRSTTTTVSSGGSGPVTSLHYAPNNNLVNGSYVPGTAYFNLADVSKLSELNSLPSDVMGLVWLGLCNGADDALTAAPPIGGVDGGKARREERVPAGIEDVGRQRVSVQR